ncbi:MAG TPA: ABC transporter substrate-binding protein [Baekduia sp.]|nr:ABC transporter substrate-binding protein [Baekduia sp.]
MTRLCVLFCLLACAVAAAGCGDDAARGDRPVSLVLDFTPNAVHAGIYLAHSRGYDEAEGVPFTIRQPSASGDSVKNLLSKRVDFAIMDIHDLALAREKGSEIVGVMALVQSPLAAVIAQPAIRDPRQLAGKRVGVTGLASDVAVLDSTIKGAGGDPSATDQVTIGFTAVPALLSGKVDAVTAFWNVEGVALAAEREGFHEFRVERFGAPSYPELVLVTARTTLQDNPNLVRATVRALRRGYQEALVDPESAIEAVMSADPSQRRTALTAQFQAISPSFTSGAKRFGDLDRGKLEAWAKWEQRFGITKRPPEVDQAFKFGL